MATNVARIQAELDLDSGKFHGSITSAIGGLKKFNSTVGDTDKSLKNIERRVSGLGASLRDTMVVMGQFRAAMGTLWAFTGQWVGAIIEANAKLERLQQLMKGLSKATNEADKVTDSIKDMNYVLDQAKKAPFTIDAIADSFVKLKASGIDPTKGAMQALMDGVARFGGTSEQLHRATIAIQQMAGKGVVSMEELRQQLGEAIPNAMQLMARATNMSMGQLVKTISLGRMAFDEVLQQKFFAEMEREFAGSSENMMNTWTGMTQKLKTEWLLFAKEIGDRGLFRGAKEALQDLMAFMSSGEGKLLARDVGMALNEALQAAAKLAKFLIENREQIISWGKILAAVFVAKKLTDFSFALISTGQQVISFTRNIGQLSAAFGAARAGTVSWTAALGAAAGPIGVAVTAITSLIFYLKMSGDEAVRAGEKMQWYLDVTSRGQTVSAEEHKGMKERLAYLREIKKATEEYKAIQSRRNRITGRLSEADSDQSVALAGRVRDLLSRGRDLGFVQDYQTRLHDIFGDLEKQTNYLGKIYTANVSEFTNKIAEQEIKQQEQRIEDIIQNYSTTLAKKVDQSAPGMSEKLNNIWNQLNTGKITQAEAQRQRTEVLGGALDQKIKSLQAARSSLADQYVNLQYDESKAKVVARLMDETNRQLEAAQSERANLSQGITLLPKMGAGGDGKQKADEYLNLFQQLTGKVADLKAQLDGGDTVPKLERFRALVAEGAYKGNAGLIGQIEALYKAIDTLDQKVKQQKATEELKQSLTDLESRASADISTARINAASTLYDQINSGMRSFNRQVEVLRNNLDQTDMSRDEFEAWVNRIKGHIAEVDFINFQKFVQDTEWENYLATLPEKARNLEEFNKKLRELEMLRQRMKEQDPNNGQAIDDGVDRVIQSETQRFHHENKSAWEKWLDDYKDITDEMGQVWANALDGMANKITDAVFTGKASFKDLATSILKEITRILVSKALAKLVEIIISAFGASAGGGGGATVNYGGTTGGLSGGGLPGYAKGGIHGPQGSVPLHKYASGGIANSPQLAMFGEGRLPEAYVPLPDGRSIPVTIQGGGGTGTIVQNTVSVQVNVQSEGGQTSTSSDVQADGKNAEQLGKMLDAKVIQVMTDEMRPGGLLWKMTKGG